MAKQNPTYAQYKKLIDRHDYAKDVFNHRPCKDRWLRAMAAPYGERWTIIRPINNALLRQHEANQATLYICANSPKVNQMGQVGFDIDAGGTHGIGTKEGAERAAALVRTLMPGIYTEASIHRFATQHVTPGCQPQSHTTPASSFRIRATSSVVRLLGYNKTRSWSVVMCLLHG